MATRAIAVLLHTWQRHVKSHPATRGGGKLNGQSNVLPCVFRECRLRHFPTVVVGSSLDCRCTRTKGKVPPPSVPIGAHPSTPCEVRGPPRIQAKVPNRNSSSENPHKLCEKKPACPKGTEVGKSSNASERRCQEAGRNQSANHDQRSDA